VLHTAAPLLGVLALIIALAWAFRTVARRSGGLASAMSAGGRAPAGVLSVLGRFPVGGGITLVLLQLDRRVLLLAHSPGSPLRGKPGSMATLCEVSDEEDVASILLRTQDERGESLSSRFNEMLQRCAASENPDTLEICDDDAAAPMGDVHAQMEAGAPGDDGPRIADQAQGLSPLRARLAAIHARRAYAEHAR